MLSSKGRSTVRSLGLFGICLLAGCAQLVEPRGLAREVRSGAFGYGGLDAVLSEWVDAEGRVDYAGLASRPERLERFYAEVAARSPDSDPGGFGTEDARLAYWLNAYNAAVLVSVSRLYPIASVEDVGVPFYLFFLPRLSGFFYLREHVFGGAAISLYELENDVVRERFGDPRIHFALNCASASCPVLPRVSFDPERLDAMLDVEARRFLGDPRNLRIDHGSREIWMSSILDWYREDFVSVLVTEARPEPTLIDYVVGYVDASMTADLRGVAADYRLRFVDYDWRLNDSTLVRSSVR